MIWESEPWKRALCADVKRLDRLLSHNGLESKLASIERTMFTAGFSIRKLMEAHKLTDRVSNLQIPCRRHRNYGEKSPDHLNWHNIDRFYNLHDYSECKLKIRSFCNFLIHSFIFIVVDDDFGNRMAGILLTTDREKEKFFYEFDYEVIRNIFLQVENDHAVKSSWRRLPNGQWKAANFGPEDN